MNGLCSKVNFIFKTFIYRNINNCYFGLQTICFFSLSIQQTTFECLMSIEVFQLALIYSFVSVKDTFWGQSLGIYILFPSGLHYLRYKVLNCWYQGPANYSQSAKSSPLPVFVISLEHSHNPFICVLSVTLCATRVEKLPQRLCGLQRLKYLQWVPYIKSL